RTAADLAKDQSYVLCGLAESSLARMRFPLGDLHKPEVREIAERARMAVASKRDSQDLCFLAGTGHSAFLERHGGLGRRPGAILDEAGRTLGEHSGSHSYTVGQRHGLGISAREPLYVLATDALANTLTVGPRERLLAQQLVVAGAVLHRDGDCIDGVRVRAHGRRFACRLPEEPPAGEHRRLVLELAEPTERTAPGQIACLYRGEVVVGYGTIAA
ncbi:MAG TPA: tRNA methyl transferase PRC-barrel domain-containing protein, partial [Solirubrobacteraceae bacterium]